LTADLSQTYESAVQAAEMVASVPVHVVDTRTASMAQGFVALAAARAAQAGADADTVLRVANVTTPRVRLYAVLDTLEYLWRGGRIGGAAALVGSTLRIKPILAVTDGKAEAIEKPRTTNRAVERMLELAVAELGDAPAHVAVVHAEALQAAQKLRDQVSRRLRCAELYLAEFTPVMGAHTGPGVLGLAFYPGDDGPV
jgi:DegV family protein with EDD domain